MNSCETEKRLWYSTKSPGFNPRVKLAQIFSSRGVDITFQTGNPQEGLSIYVADKDRGLLDSISQTPECKVLSIATNQTPGNFFTTWWLRGEVVRCAWQQRTKCRVFALACQTRANLLQEEGRIGGARYLNSMAIEYLDGYQSLTEKDLTGLVSRLVRKELKRHQPTP